MQKQASSNCSDNMMTPFMVLFFLLPGCNAVAQDLSGKVLSFPEDSDASHVKLSSGTSETPISAMTLCLRYFSAIHRGQSLFSLATPSHDNALLLFKPSISGKYRVYVEGAEHDFSGLADNNKNNEWTSMCWTWQSSTGLTQLWVNNLRSMRAYLRSNVSITGPPSIVLGQEQDTYGGGFDTKQSFVGDITDVHFWDEVIAPCQIRSYMGGLSSALGNILNWKALDYTSVGKVFVEMSDFNITPCV